MWMMCYWNSRYYWRIKWKSLKEMKIHTILWMRRSTPLWHDLSPYTRLEWNQLGSSSPQQSSFLPNSLRYHFDASSRQSSIQQVSIIPATGMASRFTFPASMERYAIVFQWSELNILHEIYYSQPAGHNVERSMYDTSDGKCTGYLWKTMYTYLWRIDANAQATRQKRRKRKSQKSFLDEVRSSLSLWSYTAVAHNDKLQPISDDHDKSIFQAHMSRANLKNVRDAYRIHIPRPFNTNKQVTSVLIDRKWHKISLQVLRNHKPLPWFEKSHNYRIPALEEWAGYNKTFIARLHNYSAEWQHQLDIFVQLLKYAYMAQTNRPTGTTPSGPKLWRHILGPAAFNRPSALCLPTISVIVPSIHRF